MVNYKTLGQSAPLALTLTTIYVVPTALNAIVNSIIVCNRSTSATSFRVAIRPLGMAIADENYIYYDVAIGGNDTFAFMEQVGIALEASDEVSVYATDATLSFSIYGQEINQ